MEEDADHTPLRDTVGGVGWLHSLPRLIRPLATLLNNFIPNLPSIGQSGVADAVHNIIRGFISHAHI